MRIHALILVLLSGCALYFPDTPGDERPPDAGPFPDAGPRPDAGPQPDAGPSGGLTARCEDGQMFAVPVPTFPDETPGHGAGRLLGACANGCRSAAVECTTSTCRDAAATLCEAPISLGATCPLAGQACRGTDAIGCPESAACSTAVPGSECQCVNGAYQCRQLTAAARTQSLLVGKWRGTVTTPGFVPPYPISLWIYPDGTYWPEALERDRTAFYYGGDGPSPRRKITVLSTSELAGSWADLAIDFGLGSAQMAEVNALTVDDTTLRFTYIPAWQECGRSFDVSLTRER
jgi:hypothetical protein